MFFLKGLCSSCMRHYDLFSLGTSQPVFVCVFFFENNTNSPKRKKNSMAAWITLLTNNVFCWKNKIIRKFPRSKSPPLLKSNLPLWPIWVWLVNVSNTKLSFFYLGHSRAHYGALGRIGTHNMHSGIFSARFYTIIRCQHQKCISSRNLLYIYRKHPWNLVDF